MASMHWRHLAAEILLRSMLGHAMAQIVMGRLSRAWRGGIHTSAKLFQRCRMLGWQFHCAFLKN